MSAVGPTMIRSGSSGYVTAVVITIWPDLVYFQIYEHIPMRDQLVLETSEPYNTERKALARWNEWSEENLR